MEDIYAIGMAIYTYKPLEPLVDEIWKWFQDVEHWSNINYKEFHFSPRDHKSLRIWRSNEKNLNNLINLIHQEQPWFLLQFGFPENILKSFPARREGLIASLTSRPQLKQGLENYQNPSLISLIAHSRIIDQSISGIMGLIELGIEAWELIDGVYGFIDIETGVPPHDDLVSEMDCIFSNLVAPDYRDEFMRWIKIQSTLDKKIWKVFWGNFLGGRHIEEVGDLKLLRQAKPDQPLEEILGLSYKNGLENLENCNCYKDKFRLKNGGLLLTLSSTPYDWFDPGTQYRKSSLQNALFRLTT